MDEKTNCPVCHTDVRVTDFFCFNCGKNLRPKPLSTSTFKQIGLYLGSFFLPPMGIIWGIAYLKEERVEAKIVGIVAIILTLVSIVATVMFIVNFTKTLNQQLNSQLPNFPGL